MPEIMRSSGLRIGLPEGLVLVEAPTASKPTRAARHYGPRPLASAAEPPSPLIASLAAQDLQAIDTLELDLTPETAAEVRAARRLERTLEMSVDIGADEGAVVLIEQDGMYSWHLPTEAAEAATRRRAGPAQRAARFSVSLGRPAADIEDRKKRGFASELIVGKVRAYVLKFAVRWGTERLISYLERNVRKGLVHMGSSDPAHWSRLDDLDGLGLPTDRPPRILLFIHGTFSSTLGSYGALGSTEEGEDLLDAANDRYDAVIGFDHPTLSLSPEDNARELLDALASYAWPAPPHLDIVTFSRGGLVYRALVELLLPKSTWRPRIDRVVFVAVPNAGTHLAEPENWHALLDLYTNLASAAGKLLSKIPQLTIATKVFDELIQGLGALGKYLATQAVTEGDVPGLAAMEPDGPFITELNRAQAGQPSIDTTFYCAVTSEFEVRLFGDWSVPREFSKRLAMTLIDQVADRLFGVPNDLVVDTQSMTAIDQITGDFIKDRLSFGKNPQVYHTVYFAQPSVALALSRWLRLDESRGAAARGGSGDWVGAGEVAAPLLPPEVETNVLVTSAKETLESLKNDLNFSPHSEFVVVRRPYEGRTLDYAYRRDEVEEALSRHLGGDTTLLDGLGMHEFQASETRGPSSPPTSPAAPAASGPTSGRIVVLDDDRPVGVVPEPDYSRTSVVSLGGEQETTGARGTSRSARGGRPERIARVSRTRSRASETAVPDVSQGEPSAVVHCHFYAEMPGVVKVGEDATLLVSVSREIIQAAAGMATAGGTAPVDPQRSVILDVRARRNFIVVGDARAVLDPPAPESPAERYFTVQPTHPGDGEVWVTARQGQVPLVTLKLHVQILEIQPGVAIPVTARASTDEPGVSPVPLCQLRIFDRTNGGSISYEYDLDIPGVIFDRFESPQIQGDRLGYVNNLYREIEQRWISTAQDITAFTEEMREMGGSLFAQLFPLELQRVLWHNPDAIRRIQVISTEPFVPWEIVHLKEPGQPLPDESLFLAQLGVVRWLHGSYYPTEVHIRRERARYLIPDYPHPDDKLPSTAVEAEYLQKTFQATPVEPHALPLRQVLRGPGSFDLLHFAGHGMAEHADIANSQLMLQGRVENGSVIPEYLSSTAVEEQSRLKGADGNRPMVVLNACQVGRTGHRLTGIGGFAPAFLKGGAGIFVSTLWSVGDRPAKAFVIKLYEELCGGAELAAAAIAARDAARAAGDASWLCYVVYGHPRARLVIED